MDEIITKLRYDQYKRKHAKDAEGRAKKDEEGNYIYIWEDCDGKTCEASQRRNETADKSHALFQSTLAGEALTIYQISYKTYADDIKEDLNEGRQPRYTQEECYLGALNGLALHTFSHAGEAAKAQKRYLREGGLKMIGEYASPHAFHGRLKQLNWFLPYFPWSKKKGSDWVMQGASPLDDDEPQEILDKARTVPIRKLMLGTGDNAKNYPNSQRYAEKLEEWYQIVQMTESLEKEEAASRKRPKEDSHNKDKSGNHKRPRYEKDKGKHKPKQPKQQRKEACKHCGGWHVAADDKCWKLPENKDKNPFRKQGGDGKKFTQKQLDEKVSFAVQKATKALKKKMSKKRHISDSDDEEAYANMISKKVDSSKNIHSDSEDSFYLGSAVENVLDNTTSPTNYLKPIVEVQPEVRSSHKEVRHASCYAFYESQRKKKAIKLAHYTAEVCVEIVDMHDNVVPIRALLDTGTSHTIILNNSTGSIRRP